jgi:hypothetical protein
MRRTGAKRFACRRPTTSAARDERTVVRDVVTARSGETVGEGYFPMEHADDGAPLERVAATGADVGFNTTVPPGVAPFLARLHDSRFGRRGGHLVCTHYEVNLLETFSADGADKRKQHGSEGAIVFRDPSEGDRVWVVFDWDEDGWQRFVSDPEAPRIMRRPGRRRGRRPHSSPLAATP